MVGDSEQAATQAAVERIFGGTWRIVLASMTGFWAGEFANSFTIAKLKVRSRGKHLWARFIASTVVGQAVDTSVFYPLAFLGIWSNEQLLSVMIANYVFKVVWEICSTPLTYAVVGFLKRAEGEDFFDDRTRFSPFSLRSEPRAARSTPGVRGLSARFRPTGKLVQGHRWRVQRHRQSRSAAHWRERQ